MEERLGEVSAKRSRWTAYVGIFLFTALTISREGMETALMLLQVHSPRLVSGALLGTGNRSRDGLGVESFRSFD